MFVIRYRRELDQGMTPAPIHREIVRYAKEPGAERSSRGERVNPGDGPRQGFLAQVLGIDRVPRPACAEALQRWGMAGKQHAKGLDLPVSVRLEQIGVRHPVEGFRRRVYGRVSDVKR